MKYEISDTGKAMLKYQVELAEEYNYKPIPIDLFTGNVRDKYEEALPEWCKVEASKEMPFYSTSGTQICNGYNRVVIGDYGAFIEITPEQMCMNNIHCKKGQEYRIENEHYANRVKYHWLTPKDNSDCKVYYQQKEVSYADYKVGMYYISPYEMFCEEKDLIKNSAEKSVGFTVQLPVSIGEIAYSVDWERIRTGYGKTMDISYERCVKEDRVSSYEIMENSNDGTITIFAYDNYHCMLGEVGSSVFGTREEAEAELNRLNEIDRLRTEKQNEEKELDL